MSEDRQLSETMLEIGAKLYPRRYHRFKDLRPFQEACEWARSLDWRNNPYDRFLLKRELQRHIEAQGLHHPSRNVYRYASREDVAAEVDCLLDRYSDRFERVGVFLYVLGAIPGAVAFKHGLVRYSPLAAALGKVRWGEGIERKQKSDG